MYANMTFGENPGWRRDRSVCKKKGQVTLPIEVRRKLNLKKGDLVAIIETDEGVLITPQEALATKALDHIGEVLKAQGISLNELIDSGRDERGRIIEQQYGISAGEPEE